MTEQELARVRDYISRCKWKWAKTYLTIPHMYIVRDKCELSLNAYNDFALMTRNLGRREKWRNYNHAYLYVDGWKYWIFDGPLDKQTVINRQKVFDEFDEIADLYCRYRVMEELPSENPQIKKILESLNGDIYEIGCGNGKLLEYIPNLAPKDYLGIDASQAMISHFKERQFNHRAIHKVFEEDGDRYLEFKYVVSIFGSASYIMPEYLDRVARNNDGGLFLMFYAPDYKPLHYDVLESRMHYFEYTKEDLIAMFPNASIYDYKGYLVVGKRPQISLFD